MALDLRLVEYGAARQVLHGVGAFGRHRRVELEGLHAQLHVDLGRHLLQLLGRTFEALSPLRTRAGHVGDEIDLGSSSWFEGADWVRVEA